MRSSIATLAIVFLALLTLTYVLTALDFSEDALTMINLAQDAAGFLLAITVVYTAYQAR
jgi:hypothetical protein